MNRIRADRPQPCARTPADLALTRDSPQDGHSYSTSPEGAVPKDGPSRWHRSLLALRRVHRTPVAPDIAFYGEVSLRHAPAAIGGLNEKSLAALEAGEDFTTAENSKDVTELPEAVKKGLKIHLQSI